MILEKYVDNGAPMQVNISDIYVRNLRKNVENQQYTISLFDEVQREVKFIMETDCINRFLKDPLYEEARTLLRELRGYCTPIQEDPFSADGLTSVEFELVRKLGIRKLLNEGDVLLMEGAFSTCVILLESGVLELSHQVNGKNEIFGSLTHKDAICEDFCLLGSLRASMTITCKAADTKVILIKACYLQTFLQSFPETCYRFYRAAAKKFATILHNHYNFLSNPLVERSVDRDWNRQWYRLNPEVRVESILETELATLRDIFPNLTPNDIPILSLFLISFSSLLLFHFLKILLLSNYDPLLFFLIIELMVQELMILF
jgi:hypothetical protein